MHSLRLERILESEREDMEEVPSDPQERVRTELMAYNTRDLSRKSPAAVNLTRLVCMTSCDLAAKESGLECVCVNNGNLTVLVGGAVDAVE